MPFHRQFRVCLRVVPAYCILSLALAAIIGCSAVARSPKKLAAPTIEKAEVVQTFPHDPEAFTQGLVFHEGYLYEGTGQNGKSTLRKVSLEDGKVIESKHLDARYFGEGITILNDLIYQLTWKENTCFVYDFKTMEYLKHHQYLGEGWGLTNDGTHLILSDGTSVLRFFDPDTFKEVRKIQVTDRNRRITNLNELEWVEGEVWANIWYEDRIARIDPTSGQILGWIDVSHVYPAQRRHPESVMNGIAYDPSSKRLFITGKNWPHLYEVKTLNLLNND